MVVSLFGSPTRAGIDWRSAPIEECWEEAAGINECVRSYGGEIPAGSGPAKIRLVPGGVEIELYSVSRDALETVVVKPRTSRLWADILRMSPSIDPAFTLRDLIDLLDLPEAVGREVYLRTMPFTGDGFGDWVRAARACPRSGKHETKVEYILVSHDVETREGQYHFGFDVSGMGEVLTKPFEGGLYGVGERVPYSLAHAPICRYLDLPLRVDDELRIPASDAETLAALRAVAKARRNGKEPARPEIPYAFRGRKAITLGEIIGAVFTEIDGISCVEKREDEAGGITG